METANLSVERIDFVVDRGKDCTPHRSQVCIHILNQGVVGATIGYQAVALEQLCVVSSNQRTKLIVRNTRVGRKQLVAVGCVGNKIAYVACHVQLVVELHHLGIGLLSLVHVHVGSRLQVWNLVLTLVRGNISIHITQLFLNNLQTVVDELGGADSNLVLILYPILVVDGNKGVEHFFCSLDGNVLVYKLDDGGLFAKKIGSQSTKACTNASQHAAAVDVDGAILIIFLLEIRRLLDAYQSDRSGDGVAQLPFGLDGFVNLLLTTHREL